MNNINTNNKYTNLKIVVYTEHFLRPSVRIPVATELFVLLYKKTLKLLSWIHD